MEFARDLFSELVKWKNGKNRKPLILKGARQVGKTSLLKLFGKKEFQDVAYFNFEERPELKSNFQHSKEVNRILQNLSVIHGKKIMPQETLIIFDEIQECNEALNTLKYFCENAPEYAIAAAGSLLGITLGNKGGFPVGKVEFLTLYPLTFHEFLQSKSEKLYHYSKSIGDLMPILDVFFNELMDLFKIYLISGGMPEPAKYMVTTMDISEVQKSLDQIQNSYIMDFSKHNEKNETNKITYVWNSIPSQLARENKKFIYQLVKSGARAREFENSLLWLEQAGMIYRVFLCKKPTHPVSHYDDLLVFKIYLIDVGLLRMKSRLDPLIFKDDNRLFTEFKGALTENYILQSLVNQFETLPRYWKSNSDAEIDFLVEYKNSIIPIEVKSSEHNKSKSLTFYSKQFLPGLRIRYSLKNLDYNDGLLSIPIFLADHTRKFIDIALNYKKKGVLKILDKYVY